MIESEIQIKWKEFNINVRRWIKNKKQTKQIVELMLDAHSTLNELYK